MNGSKTTIKSLVRDITYFIMLYISKILVHFPKKENLWVFGAWRGKLYADNSKYMFEYVNKFHPEINAVWISREKIVVKEIRQKGYKAYHRNNLMGIMTCLRAQAAFLTEDRHDISRILISGAIIVQLWHGMGIKDIMRISPKERSSVQERYDMVVHSHQDEYWMVACEEAVEKYSKAFSLSKQKMFITGQPKDDTFINIAGNVFIERIRKAHSNCKIVVYLPTHRNFGAKGTTAVLNYEVLKEVNDKLAQKNIVMIFKPHAHEFKNYDGVNVDLSNIVFATDSQVYGDVYEFLPVCDMMITDYSGVMLGYLASRKPMIYFAYDLDEYISADAGFCYTYDEVTAGPVCRSWNEVIEALGQLAQEDVYAERREQLRKRFCPMADGDSCKRIFMKVREIRTNAGVGVNEKV